MTAGSRHMFGPKESGASKFENMKNRGKHSIFRGKVVRDCQYILEKLLWELVPTRPQQNSFCNGFRLYVFMLEM